MPAVTLIEFYEKFPETDLERKAIAREWVPRLTEAWFSHELPAPNIFHVLVHRPGEVTADSAHAVHVIDQATAEARESGTVAVAISLTDFIKGFESIEAWRIRRNPRP
ncbi:hypothetical protein FHX75_11613 [Micromonospora palomenae]|uniref:Uncharacterized protein n=1 Tax=Micromonospora palomenae TaxID=1461247 RepID=A0A561WUE6_9ACTN|nr:hypothetical protein [Micromonospora palomenae]TWG27475.1 hypothetical protein FHX75_11613 [Micromonospora palomenae]